MISKHSKISLSQFLNLFDHNNLKFLLNKHFPMDNYFSPDDSFPGQGLIKSSFSNVTIENIMNLLDEIIRTENDLRNLVTPRYRFDERWKDLIHCLYLDGFKIENKQLIALDPSIDGKEAVEDDLTREIKKSDLQQKEEVLRLLNNSTEDFKKSPPDYNGCLSNARIAFQYLSTTIANSPKLSHPKNFDTTKWGQVLNYLRVSSFITVKEEEGLSGVYSFISPGTHLPVGFDEEEFTRLGRSLAVSMCYFLIKSYNSI